jgi:uncharacterized protein
MKIIPVPVIWVVLAVSSRAQNEPIIDMHLHALRASSQGPPPVSLCTPPAGYPPVESGAEWNARFMALLKNAPCDKPLRSPATDDELMKRTLAIMKRRNIFGVASGPLTEQWHKEASDRIIPGLGFTLGPDAPTVSRMVELFKSGRFAVLGEVGLQYQGIEPSDDRFEPYLTAAEQMDIPVAIHVGPGPPGAPYFPGTGAYRARLHTPLVLEEALVRHPKLRVIAMHAGWPMLDDTLAMLWAHPQLYVDVGVISFAIPRAAFHNYLRAIVEAGFGHRVLFGSDQMVWPEAIEVAIGSIEMAAFLSQSQKRDILYNNAARFLRLSEDQIARHHGKQ